MPRKLKTQFIEAPDTWHSSMIGTGLQRMYRYKEIDPADPRTRMKEFAIVENDENAMGEGKAYTRHTELGTFMAQISLKDPLTDEQILGRKGGKRVTIPVTPVAALLPKRIYEALVHRAALEANKPEAKRLRAAHVVQSDQDDADTESDNFEEDFQRRVAANPDPNALRGPPPPLMEHERAQAAGRDEPDSDRDVGEGDDNEPGIAYEGNIPIPDPSADLAVFADVPEQRQFNPERGREANFDRMKEMREEAQKLLEQWDVINRGENNMTPAARITSLDEITAAIKETNLFYRQFMMYYPPFRRGD